MVHLRADLQRLYDQRKRLFDERWSQDPASYVQAALDMNMRIRGLELLICEHFRESLPSIFRPVRTAED